jgi:hypothetical protein
MLESRGSTYLVTISPEVVFGTEVLVRVLGLVLTGSVVSNVLPMGVPPQLAVDGGDDHAGDSDAEMVVSMFPKSRRLDIPSSSSAIRPFQ